MTLRSDRMNAVMDFRSELPSVGGLATLNREWPYWSGVHPASPTLLDDQQFPIKYSRPTRTACYNIEKRNNSTAKRERKR